MDWSHLKVALAVSRGGSLTRAAQLLGMDQTTAGRRLNALEDQLGVALFVRAKSGFLPTEQGQLVVERALKVEAEIDRMGEDIAASQAGAVGVVRLMGNNWVLERLATDVMPGLCAQHPKLEMVLSGRLPPAPLHGEATMSFWYDAAPHASEVSIPFCRVPYAAYRALNAECDPFDWVLFRDDDAHGPSFSRLVRKRLGPHARVRLTATDAHILRNAARASVGQTMLPVCIGDIDPALQRVEGPGLATDRIMHLHINADTAETRRVQIVLAAIAERIEDALGARLLTPPDRILKTLTTARR
jgi:DNA-binding transcriptional LysR family regulator